MAAFLCVALLPSPAFAQFTQTPVPGLPAVFSGSVAWDDYDNDGRLDFLLSGSDGAMVRPRRSLWRNTGGEFTNMPIAGLPGVAQSAEILARGRLEIHRDMHLSHAEFGNNAPLVSERVVGCRKCQIDDHLKTSLANPAKLLLGGLARGPYRSPMAQKL